MPSEKGDNNNDNNNNGSNENGGRRAKQTSQGHELKEPPQSRFKFLFS